MLRTASAAMADERGPTPRFLLHAATRGAIRSRVGFCAVMRKDSGVECTEDDRAGQWSDTRSLAECLARCAQCPRCAYATYRPAGSDDTYRPAGSDDDGGSSSADCAWNMKCETMHADLPGGRDSGRRVNCKTWRALLCPDLRTRTRGHILEQTEWRSTRGTPMHAALYLT